MANIKNLMLFRRKILFIGEVWRLISIKTALINESRSWSQTKILFAVLRIKKILNSRILVWKCLFFKLWICFRFVKHYKGINNKGLKLIEIVSECFNCETRVFFSKNIFHSGKVSILSVRFFSNLEIIYEILQCKFM